MEDPKAEHSTPKQVPSPCSECPDSGSEGSELDCERTPTLYGILGVSIMVSTFLPCIWLRPAGWRAPG